MTQYVSEFAWVDVNVVNSAVYALHVPALRISARSPSATIMAYAAAESGLSAAPVRQYLVSGLAGTQAVDRHTWCVLRAQGISHDEITRAPRRNDIVGLSAGRGHQSGSPCRAHAQLLTDRDPSGARRQPANILYVAVCRAQVLYNNSAHFEVSVQRTFPRDTRCMPQNVDLFRACFRADKDRRSASSEPARSV